MAIIRPMPSETHAVWTVLVITEDNRFSVKSLTLQEMKDAYQGGSARIRSRKKNIFLRFVFHADTDICGFEEISLESS